MDYSNYVLFCSHNKCQYTENPDRAVFSQWRYSKFIDENGTTYNSGEQYMMYHKALLMNDHTIATKILAIDIQDNTQKNESKVNYSKIKKIKDLGRSISNFNQELWDANKFDIVRKGNFLKFSQNKNLKKILLSTGNKILVEASHYDKIWGIGLSESDAYKLCPEDFLKNGQNLLGKILMSVRDELKS